MRRRLKPQDKVFAEKTDRARDFAFDSTVAHVFDDMVGRSVPYYDEIQRMTCQLAADFAQPDSNIYDLGCSTGTTFELLDPLIDPGITLIGIDNSAPMLAEAETKLAQVASRRKLHLKTASIEDSYALENASVVLMVLTLQFVRPLHRERVARKIFDGMNRNGALIIVEKLLWPTACSTGCSSNITMPTSANRAIPIPKSPRNARHWKTCWCPTGWRKTWPFCKGRALPMSRISSAGTISPASSR